MRVVVIFQFDIEYIGQIAVQYLKDTMIMRLLFKNALLVILSLFLFSCAGKPTEAPLERIVEEVPEPEGVIQVWKTAVETVLFADGAVDKVTYYKYDTLGNIQSAVEKNFKDELISQIVYEWDDGNLHRMTKSDQNGVVFESNYIVEDGNILQKTRLDKEGNPQLRIEYQYDNDRLMESSIYDSKGVHQLKSVYAYEDGLLTSVEDFLPSGIPDALFERVIQQGKVMSERTILPDGTVEKEKTIEYSGDIVVSETYFSRSKQIKSVQYEYDDYGNIIKETWVNRSGKAYEIVEKDWISIDVER